MGCELAHLLAALFLQITLTGAQPDKGGAAVDLGQVFFDKIDQNDGLTRAGRRLDNDGLLGSTVGHDIHQLDDRFGSNIGLTEYGRDHINDIAGAPDRFSAAAGAQFAFRTPAGQSMDNVDMSIDDFQNAHTACFPRRWR